MTASMLHAGEREIGKGESKKWEPMEWNEMQVGGGKKKKLFRKMMQTKIRFPIWHVSNLPHSYTPLIIPRFLPWDF